MMGAGWHVPVIFAVMPGAPVLGAAVCAAMGLLRAPTTAAAPLPAVTG